MRFNCTCIYNNDIKEQHHHCNQEDTRYDITSAYPVYEHNMVTPQEVMKCMLCEMNLNNDENSFVKTKCGHNFCFNCFMNSSNQIGKIHCPTCKMILYSSKQNVSSYTNKTEICYENSKIIADIEKSLRSMNNTINAM